MSEQLHTAHLEALLGYNTRRAALHIIGAFMQNMEAFDLRPAEFSVLSLIRHNPGITSRQLCAALSILPPNLVVILKQFEKRGLIARKPHPTDGRAIGLSLTDTGGCSRRGVSQIRCDLNPIADGNRAQNAHAFAEKNLPERLNGFTPWP